MGQSIVFSEIKAQVPLENDIASHQNLLLQRYEERIKLLSQENKVSKFCNGCRIYTCCWSGTIFHDERHLWFQTISYSGLSWINSSKRWWINHNQEDGFREIRESDPYWKSRPVICTVNMELKSESGLWEKIILILGSEFLMDQTNLWLIQITTTQKSLTICLKNKRHNRLWRSLQPDQRRNQNHKEEKPVDVQSIIPMNERKWIDVEPGESSFSAYEISKKVINFLRHSQTVQREETTEAVQFWRIKNFLQNQFPQIIIGRMIVGKHACQQEEERKGHISTVLYWYFRNNFLFPSSSRTFRTQLYWSFITGQCDNSEWILPNKFIT